MTKEISINVQLPKKSEQEDIFGQKKSAEKNESKPLKTGGLFDQKQNDDQEKGWKTPGLFQSKAEEVVSDLKKPNETKEKAPLFAESKPDDAANKEKAKGSLFDNPSSGPSLFSTDNSQEQKSLFSKPMALKKEVSTVGGGSGGSLFSAPKKPEGGLFTIQEHPSEEMLSKESKETPQTSLFGKPSTEKKSLFAQDNKPSLFDKPAETTDKPPEQRASLFDQKPSATSLFDQKPGTTSLFNQTSDNKQGSTGCAIA